MARPIDIHNDDECFYGSSSAMPAGGSNMLLNSDEDEADSDEVIFTAFQTCNVGNRLRSN